MSKELTETHKYQFDSIGNPERKYFIYEGTLKCGNVPSKEEYEYYDCGKLKTKYIYDSGKTWKDVYEYNNCDLLLKINLHKKCFPKLPLFGKKK